MKFTALIATLALAASLSACRDRSFNTPNDTTPAARRAEESGGSFVPSQSPFYAQLKPLRLALRSGIDIFLGPTGPNGLDHWRDPLPPNYRPPEGMLEVVNLDNPRDVVRVQAKRVFGRFGKTCNFPKLHVVFPSDIPEASVFHGVRETYLSLPCETQAPLATVPIFLRRDLEQEKKDIEIDMFLYKFFAATGFPAIDIRRADIAIDGSSKKVTLPGYFTESVQELAARHPGADLYYSNHNEQNVSPKHGSFAVSAEAQALYNAQIRLFRITDHSFETTRDGFLTETKNVYFVHLPQRPGFFVNIDLDSDTLREMAAGSSFQEEAIANALAFPLPPASVCTMIDPMVRSTSGLNTQAFVSSLITQSERFQLQVMRFVDAFKSRLMAVAQAKSCKSLRP